MNTKPKKIPVSFKENETYIYNHIKSKLNFSAYIKELVIKDMSYSKDIKLENKKNKKKAFRKGKKRTKEKKR